MYMEVDVGVIYIHILTEFYLCLLASDHITINMYDSDYQAL